MIYIKNTKCLLIVLLLFFASYSFAQNGAEAILEGHQYTVYGLDFNPKGGELATASWDNTIRIWDTETKTLKKILPKLNYPLFCVKYSNDGNRIAGSGKFSTITIWDANTGYPIHILNDHSGWVYSCSFSPDGKLLASCGTDKTIKIWNTNNGKLLKTLSHHSDAVRCVSFSKKGDKIACGSDDNNISVWDVENGQLLSILKGHTEDVWDLKFYNDDKYIISGSRDKTIRKWDVHTKKEIFKIDSPTGWVNSIDVNQSESVFLSTAHRQVCLWNMANGRLLKTLNEDAGTVYQARFSPDSKLVSSTYKQAALIWDVHEAILSITLAKLKWLTPNSSDSVVYQQHNIIELNIKSDSIIRQFNLFLNDSIRLSKSDFFFDKIDNQIPNLTDTLSFLPGKNKVSFFIENSSSKSFFERNFIYPFYKSETKSNQLAILINNDKQNTQSINDAFIRLRNKCLSNNIDVFHYEKLSVEQLKQIAIDIENYAPNYKSVLFYYKGKALSDNGLITLFPVTKNINDNQIQGETTFTLNTLLNKFEQSTSKNIILDLPLNYEQSLKFISTIPSKNTRLVFNFNLKNTYKFSFTTHFSNIYNSDNFGTLIPLLRKEVDLKTNGENLLMELNTLIDVNEK